jgi:hypothetical protein
MKRLLPAALVALLAACGAESAPRPAVHKFSSNAGKFQVALQSRPSPIPMNEPFDVSFTVTPAEGIGVEVDARMPAHFHGMNRTAKLSRQPDGSWKAEGLLFHMPGHWELYVDITRGGVTERAQMDVDLK